jgi:ParB-like chromosome segregation protein Spo0J
MKIKVSDIEPNPYRDFETYPIDRERVEGLKDSINKDTFWGGIPARPHPTKKGKYQIGCGHHRLVCFKEIGIKEIEMPIVLFTDAQMLRVMINENVEYEPRPKLINSDVEKAKKFLDDELAKYETWEKIRSEKNIRAILGVDNGQAFAALKNKGAGRATILAYLGKPWAKRGWMIQAALATLKDSKTYLDRDAAETIPTVDQANVFRCAVKNHDIPKKTQKKIAKKIKEEKIGSKHIPDLVADHSLKPAKKEPKPLPTLDTYVTQTTKMMFDLMQRISHVRKHLDNVLSESVYVEFNLHVIDLINKLKSVNKELQDAQKKEKKKKVL